jgi:hypothetical protein
MQCCRQSSVLFTLSIFIVCDTPKVTSQHVSAHGSMERWGKAAPTQRPELTDEERIAGIIGKFFQ